MAEFKVSCTAHHEIVVEAENPEDAESISKDVTWDEWGTWDGEYQVEQETTSTIPHDFFALAHQIEEDD